ncbi:MAG: DUF58 domain-containing protein [Planctomycetota bacterium]
MSGSLLDDSFLNLLATLSLKLKHYLLGNKSRSQKRGNSLEFGGYRSYSHGDDFRYVDWNIYGRLGQLVVKEFEAEEIFKVVLYLDRSPSMNYGQFHKLTFAKKLAALLGYLTLFEGNQLLLISSPEEKPLSFSGAKSLLEFLSYLQELPATSKDFYTLPRVNQGHGRSLGILLSDLYTLDPEKEVGPVGRFHYQFLTIHLVDPTEWVLPTTGLVRFQDLETQEKLALDWTPKLAQAYQKKFSAFIKKRELSCHSKGLRYLRLDTSSPFDMNLAIKLVQTGVFH